MNMRLKKKVKKKIKMFLLIILFLSIISVGFLTWKKLNSKENNIEEKKEIEIEQNDEPINTGHDNEFEINNSNYIEANYDRYIEYKKNHSEYSDDEIITYVNIGLDREFYTEMEDVDMSLGYLILCNKYHLLKSDYVPDLVDLPSKYGGGKLEREAASFFMKMVDAAKADGIKLRNVSGYRSYNTQKNLYNNYVKRDGVAKADTYSARAGSSEHQTGLASDINTASSSAHFENTKEYDWLIKNSYKYGFILRYLKDKTYITGYKYEPWHFRYVGVDVATKISELGITFEEYHATYIMKG